MRLKKGTKVEVLIREEGSIGAWRSADVISGDGRKYCVRYNSNAGWSEVQAERVPRKAIRPFPPPVQVIEGWVPGDIVEVYHNQLWKPAIIVNVDSSNNYTVRLLGYTEEFTSHRLQLRVRQVWQDDKWFVLGKGIQTCSTGRKRLHGDRELLHVQRSCFSGDVPNPYILSKESANMKLPFPSSAVGGYHIGPRKRRFIEKDVRDQQLHSANPFSLGKVDAPKESFGGNNFHSSSRNQRTGLIKADVGGSTDSLQFRPSTMKDSYSCTSSVGSCSANSGDRACSFVDHRDTENADESSDAESSCGKDYKDKVHLLHMEKKSSARSHSSELRAYGCAIQALFASGPFSWEAETNMSNLRQSLHISDDEHLTLMMVPRQILMAMVRGLLSFLKCLKIMLGGSWSWCIHADALKDSALVDARMEKILKSQY